MILFKYGVAKLECVLRVVARANKRGLLVGCIVRALAIEGRI